MTKQEIMKYIDSIDFGQMVQHGLINGNVDGKFNPMAIGWGQSGWLWGRPVVNLYVRPHRYTHDGVQEEFTVSLCPQRDNNIMKVTGTMSGRDIDKVEELGLTLVEPKVINTKAIKEMPITLECKVIYKHKFDWKDMPEEVKKGFYSQADDKGFLESNDYDGHTVLTAEVVSAYEVK